jgi:hypothetical protein
MVWANLIVLGLGGLLLTIPIVLHFLMQPKPVVLTFPALQFVRQRQLANRSRMRLRHVLLLLLRCLLILILAAALAGPSVASRVYGDWLTLAAVSASALIISMILAAAFWTRSRRNWTLVALLSLLLCGHLLYAGWSLWKLVQNESAQLIGDSQAPISALIVIDTSCRMSFQEENSTRIDRAKDTANWLTEQFPSDSQICVMATDGEAPFFSVDAGAARNRIQNLQTTFVPFDLPRAIEAGLKLLDDAIHERHEIYVITDGSRRSWLTQGAVSLIKKLEARPATQLFVVDLGHDHPQNFSLAPIRLSAATISQGGEMTIDTAVQRSGDAAQRNIRLMIEKPDPTGTLPVVRDRRVIVPDKFWERSQSVDIRENFTAPVRFRFSEQLPLGVHHGRVEIVGNDALPVDDVRFFTIEVRTEWNVLIVHPSDVSPTNLVEVLGGGIDTGRSRYDVKIIAQRDLAGENLNIFDAVFLMNPEDAISTTLWTTLADYVKAGGGLGIFLGHKAAAGGGGPGESFQVPVAEQLLGGRLTRQWFRPDDPDVEPLYFSPDSLAHEIFAPFRSWETAVPWNRFPVYVYWGFQPDEQLEQGSVHVLLRYGNGHPALVLRTIGDGRVLLMTTPITEVDQPEGRVSWNKLFIGYPIAAYLLVREAANYLSRSQVDSLNVDVGQTAILHNDPSEFPDSYRIFTPRTDQAPAQISPIDGKIRYRFTETPGNYRLKGQMDEIVLRGFSANLAADETDLTRITPSELDQILGAESYQLATERTEIQRQQGTTRRGQEFYPVLLLLLAVILGVEYLMSNRFYS